MSSNPLCLLCLQVINQAAKPPRKIRLEAICNLLSLYYQNYQFGLHLPPDVENNRICEFCDDCYLLFSTMGEIRRQISLLEEEIGSKMKKIQTTISRTSFSPQLRNNGMEKILHFREIFLRLAGENEDNFVSEVDKVQVKVEQEEEEGGEDDLDPLTDVSDQFYVDDLDSYSQASDESNNDDVDPLEFVDVVDQLFCDDVNSSWETKIEKIEVQDFVDEDQTAFDSISWAQNNLTKPKKNFNCATKRKREDSPPLPKITSKRRPDAVSTPQFSTRIKKRIASPTGVKNLVSSPKKIRPVNPISNWLSVEGDDVKFTPDWTPSIEHVDSIATSDAIRSRKCTQCAKSFKAESTLILHTSRCHGTPCIAPLYTATFHSITLRDAHMKTVHGGLTPYKCRICTSKFRSQNELAAHMVMRHEKGEKKLSCVKCGTKFCLEENLARHLTLHDVEGIKPFVCDLCDNRFESQERLKRHLATLIHSNPFQCSECPQKCRTKAALERHLRSHTNEKTVKCPHCDQVYGNKYSLQHHIARAHPSGPATHICHICGKGYYVHSDLKMHLTRHDGTFRKKCDACGENVLSSSSLQAHLVKMHGKDSFVHDERNRGAGFTSREEFKRRKKIYTGEKLHKCQTCGACFTEKTSLDRHTRGHTGERPYACPHCDKAFKMRRDIRNHVKVIHTPGYVAPTPHKCPHCDKGYRTPFWLRCHIRQSHTRERPFVCDQCGKGFTVKSGLSRHLKTAHGIFPEKTNRLPRL